MKNKLSIKTKSIIKHVAFVAAAFTAISLWKITPDPVIAYLLALNVITFASFGLDKLFAVSNAKNRTPERTFHTLGILGAFPAILLGRLIFRHKSAKAEFSNVMWFLFVLQIVAVSFYLLQGLLQA